MTTTPQQWPGKLPRGIWWDEKRQRWRVRVYRRNRCIHLSYHKELVDALNAYWAAKDRQRWLRCHDDCAIVTVADQVEALKTKII